MPADFYTVLGTADDASGAELKAAYRSLVREYHPDVTDDPDAEAKFRLVRKAHDVLSNPVERKTYDRLGHREYVAKEFDSLPALSLFSHIEDSPSPRSATDSGDDDAAGGTNGTDSGSTPTTESASGGPRQDTSRQRTEDRSRPSGSAANGQSASGQTAGTTRSSQSAGAASTTNSSRESQRTTSQSTSESSTATGSSATGSSSAAGSATASSSSSNRTSSGQRSASGGVSSAGGTASTGSSAGSATAGATTNRSTRTSTSTETTGPERAADDDEKPSHVGDQFTREEAERNMAERVGTSEPTVSTGRTHRRGLKRWYGVVVLASLVYLGGLGAYAAAHLGALAPLSSRLSVAPVPTLTATGGLPSPTTFALSPLTSQTPTLGAALLVGVAVLPLVVGTTVGRFGRGTAWLYVAGSAVPAVALGAWSLFAIPLWLAVVTLVVAPVLGAGAFLYDVGRYLSATRTA